MEIKENTDKQNNLPRYIQKLGNTDWKRFRNEHIVQSSSDKTVSNVTQTLSMPAGPSKVISPHLFINYKCSKRNSDRHLTLKVSKNQIQIMTDYE
ncbi:hypothetical protein CHS0354_040712 [Potamilus streckersoni]|uniref:Uncharacterized protein n=1 Tax=Potamilus streckersoni TaxID=2493646 RepID=A0AAE0SLK7_9BIVA|nr:hypothetical protein CHS0354_040712 [Potamilus streckersoni]